MNNEELYDKIKKQIAALKGKTDVKTNTRLRITLLERCVKRLFSYTESCEQCKSYISELEKLLNNDLKVNKLKEKSALNNYNLWLKGTIAHLQKKHKLISEGFYLSIYMSLGMCFGVPMGLLFDNIALGLPIGMCFGIAIGASFDASAKKKGMVI